MGVFSLIGAIFRALGSSLVSIISFILSIEFFFGEKVGPVMRFFRIIGFFAFLSLIIQSIVIANDKMPDLETGEPKYVVLHILKFLSMVLGQFSILFFSIDNAIYSTSKSFAMLPNPTLWNAFTTFIIVISRSFFYLWWYRVAVWSIKTFGLFGFDKSVIDIKVYGYAFLLLTGFVILTNIIGMVAWGQITFTGFEGNIAQKTQQFFTKNFPSTWDFIVLFVPYKGIFHYLIFSVSKSILLLTGGWSQTFGNKITDEAISNISNISAQMI